jgi:transmembrane sensor
MNPPPAPDSESPQAVSARIEDEAIAWLAERDDGMLPARARDYARWLRADPRHAAAVARLEQTLELLHELPQHRSELNATFDRAAPVVPFPPVAAGPSPRVSRRWPRRLAWGGLAAALALGLTAGWRARPAPPELHLATTAAGYERARLDDGSTLELNAASAVRVQFSAAERRVELEAGEAHFAVAHDAARPFVVSAGGVSVRAVGTAFNVRFASGAVEVIVVEGRVAVQPPPAGSARGGGSPAGAGPVFLSARERLSLRVASHPVPSVEKVTPGALREALAWQGRLAEFGGVPLADVVARFNARNRIQLVLDDPELGARRIGGTFALDEVEAFVRLLERDGEIVAERRGESEIRMRRAR